jgi:DNA-directed RNA polymerase sigma subunit (sigma70/sigma32)
VKNGISGWRNLGWDPKEVRLMKSTMPDATSLDRPAGSDTESGWLAGSIEDEEASDAPDVVTQEIEAEQLRRAVEDLPRRERCVPTRRCGLDGCEQASYLGARGEVG